MSRLKRAQVDLTIGRCDATRAAASGWATDVRNAPAPRGGPWRIWGAPVRRRRERGASVYFR
jgi:hypothetical protein